MLLLWPLTGNAVNWYVDNISDPGEDGSVAHPFDCIQEALNVAFPGDIVLVRDGIYRGPGNKNLDFYGKAIVLESQNGWSNTVLDCEGVGRAFYLHSGETTNTVIRGFCIQGANTNVVSEAGQEGEEGLYVQIFGTSPSAVLCISNSGFTMESCVIKDSQALTSNLVFTVGQPGEEGFFLNTAEGDGSGGAIYGVGCDVVLRDVIVEKNRAGEHGGAIYVCSNSSLRLEGVTIRGNRAASRYIQEILTIGVPGSEGFYQIVTSYSATGAGGALYADQSYIFLSNCWLSGNSAGAAGGGLFATNDSFVVMFGTTIEGNSVLSTDPTGWGGGVAQSSGFLRMQGCFVSGNACLGQTVNEGLTIGVEGVEGFFVWHSYQLFVGKGGGLGVQNADSVVLENCQFIHNQAGLTGGGVWARDVGWFLMDSCSLNENLVHDNQSGLGGGIAMERLPLSASNLEFRQNRVGGPFAREGLQVDSPEGMGYFFEVKTETSAGRGGALALQNVTGLFHRLRLANNRASTAGGGLFVQDSSRISINEFVCQSNHAIAVQTDTREELTSPNQARRHVVQQEKGGEGGAVWVDDAELIVSQSWWQANRAGDFGGALCQHSSEVRFVSALLVENMAGREVSHITTTNQASGTFAEVSYAESFTGRGSAVGSDAGSARLTHLTAWRNGGLTGLDFTNGALALLENSIVWSNALAADTPGMVQARYCFVEGGWPGTSNRPVSPQLTRRGRLTAESPAVDAAEVSAAPDLDFEGEARVDHPVHVNQPSTADCGADEFVDQDHDDLADVWEIAFWGTTSRSGTTLDNDRDGASDLDEYRYGTSPLARDSDADKIPDGWEMHRGLDPLRASAAADSDEDEYSNLDEYIADTYPLDAESYLHFDDIRSIAGRNGVLLAWTASTQRWYVVESIDLLNGEWRKVAEYPGTGLWQTVFAPDPTLEPERHYRLRVRLP